MTTAAEEYCAGVVSGEITACGKLRKLCGMLLPRYADGYRAWHYDPALAERPVEFMERFCCIPSGRRFGRPFLLEPYEKFAIETAFGFVDDDGRRQFQEVLWWIAKKNGKTALAAALVHFMMVADHEGKPECYVIASAEQQAGLCYGGVDTMRRQSPLLKKWERTGEVRDRHKQGIMCDATNGYVVTLSGHPEHLDGPNPHLVVADEIAAWRDRGPYDQLRLALTREQPMIWELTTANSVRNSIGDDQYDYARRVLDGEVEDDRFLPIIYEQDSPDEWLDESMWAKSNPGLGTVKSLDSLRSFATKAMNDSTQRSSVLMKHFNIPQNSSTAWLSYEECGSDEKMDFFGMGFRYAVLGFDYAESVDLTCCQVMCMRGAKDEDGNLLDDTIYEHTMYWIPESKLEERESAGRGDTTDHAPYRKWHDMGLLRIVPGSYVPASVLTDYIAELRREHGIYAFCIGYDPWHVIGADREMMEQIVGKDRCEVVRQGAQTLSDPMKRLREDYRRHRIVDGANPINRWCRLNVMVTTDRNLNIMPDKKAGKSENRIDGFMAELDAYIALDRHWDEFTSLIK